MNAVTPVAPDAEPEAPEPLPFSATQLRAAMMKLPDLRTLPEKVGLVIFAAMEACAHLLPDRRDAELLAYEALEMSPCPNLIAGPDGEDTAESDAAFSAWIKRADALRDAMKNPWRVLHEAIAHHAPVKGSPAPKPVTRPVASATATAFAIIRAADLEGRDVPVQRYILPGLVPIGCVTMDYADAGLGKTLLAQLLATSCAAGVPFLGIEAERCRAFCLFAEDDEATIHGRQGAINAAAGLTFDVLGDLAWTCPVADDNVLARTGRGGIVEPTARFDALREYLLDTRVRLLAIDTAATAFGGDENDRHQVSAFVGRILTGLAREMDGAILLNAHPSRSGMRSGDGTSGSTAWKGSARSLWTLTRPERSTDPDVRTLTLAKANGARAGQSIPLRWQAGTFVVDSAASARAAPANDSTARCPATPAAVLARPGSGAPACAETAEATFLRLLQRFTAAGQHMSASRHAVGYAPRQFAKHGDRSGHTQDAFTAAMAQLLGAGQIRCEEYNRYGSEHLVVVDEAAAAAL